jgi:hypothetical protein
MLVLPQTTVNTNNDAEIEEPTEAATDFYVEVTYRLSNIQRTVRAAFTDINKLPQTDEKEGLTFEMGRQYALTLAFEDTDIKFNIDVEGWEADEQLAYAATTVVFNANKPAEASDSDAVDHIHDPNSGFIYGQPLPALYYDKASDPDTTPPSLTKWYFLGYFDSPEGGTQYYKADLDPVYGITWDKVGPSCTLYAHWTDHLFGRSNIYFQPDAGETEIGSLTFSEDDSSKSGYQGLYFKWGSLIGVSATGAFPGGAYLYIPAVKPGVNTGKYYKVQVVDVVGDYSAGTSDMNTAVQAYASIYPSVTNWTDHIPSATDGDLGVGSEVHTHRELSPLTDASEQTLYEKYKGDICKFLSDNKEASKLTRSWVMPKSEVWKGPAYGGSYSDVNSSLSAINFRYEPGQSWSGSGSFSGTDENGTNVTADALMTYTLATNEEVIFPAAGYRYGGQLLGVGYYGYYWSSSVYDASDAYNLYFLSGGVGPDGGDGRTNGFPVRCVQEFK